MDLQQTSSSSLTASQDEQNDPSFHDETGVLFYVNRDGLPMSDSNWERMWRHVESTHPDKLKMVSTIRDNPNLDKVPMATPPVLTASMSVKEKLKVIQNYLKQLQYNHTGTQLFEIRKNRPLSGLMDTAREIIKESLPIKCLEAVIASLYLTSSMTELQRFTISFKTQFRGHYYRHIVLGVAANSKFGALGLSRRDDLMYRPLEFKSLSDLINNFIDSYKKYEHSVKKIKLSLPIVHDLHSCEKIYWKYIYFCPHKLSAVDMKKLLDKYAREIRHTASHSCATSPKKSADSTPD